MGGGGAGTHKACGKSDSHLVALSTGWAGVALLEDVNCGSDAEGRGGEVLAIGEPLGPGSSECILDASCGWIGWSPCKRKKHFKSGLGQSLFD